MKLSEIKYNPANPRQIKDDKFNKLVKSLKEFPEAKNDSIVLISESMAIIGKSKNGKAKLRMFECQFCHEWFNSKKYTKDNHPKYCSSKCYGESIKVNKKCKLCGNIINGKGASVKIRVFCSKECQSIARRGIKLNNEWKSALSKGRRNSEKCKGYNLYNWKGGKLTEKERFRNHNKKRHYKIKAGGDLPMTYIKELKRVQNNKCFYCEKSLLQNGKTHIEHLIPISRGGTNHWQNIVISCQSCNNQKKTLTLLEFSIKKRQLRWLDKSIIVQYTAWKKSTYNGI